MKRENELCVEPVAAWTELLPELWLLVLDRLDSVSRVTLFHTARAFQHLVRVHLRSIGKRRILQKWHVCGAAAHRGYLSVVQWARANNSHRFLVCRDACDCLEVTHKEAARRGDFQVLEWTIQCGTPVSFKTCDAAVEGGQLALLQWLRARGCPWYTWTCAGAAHYGHLEVLQWCHSEGCPWDGLTCALAARGGHLAVLQWARAHGCPWDSRVVQEARKAGHAALLRWAIDNGCPSESQWLQ